MSREQIICFQLLVYTHLNSIQISSADLKCLTLLGLYGQAELIVFCNELVKRNIFGSMQSARNALSKLKDKGLVEKQGEGMDGRRKRLYLHPELSMIIEGSVIIQYNCLHLATEEN